LLEHGGRIAQAAARWNIAPADWLDLSTGIAPWPYPLPLPPVEVWQRLPEEEDGLEDAARMCYGVEAGSAGGLPLRGSIDMLALPGTQAAIQALPRLLAPGRVAMPAPLYAEHPAAWRAAGHEIVAWDAPSDYAVLCNPNNPTGARRERAALLERAHGLRLLLVDEAFIDAQPAESLAGCGAENIVVLRSLGKFFGLAGARVGFAFGPQALLARLREAIGPWAVAHPARWAARRALADSAWQAAQRERLRTASARLDALLREAGFAGTTGTALFRYAPTPRAAGLHEALARRGILVRRFDDPPALRVGLPGNEHDWRRLADALKEIACAA
jgi:cobalamin biosynthetic protein CobC